MRCDFMLLLSLTLCNSPYITFSQLAPVQDPKPEKKTLTVEQFESLPERTNQHTEDRQETDSSDSQESDPELGEVGAVSSDPVPPKTLTFDESVDEASDPELGQMSTVIAAPLKTPTVLRDNGSVNKNDQSASKEVDSSSTSDADTVDTSHDSCRWSSECAICLDVFQPDDKLIVLPRCQHAFHKDCIKPWLLERLWSCPLCKTSVLKELEAPSDDSTPRATNGAADEGSANVSTSSR